LHDQKHFHVREELGGTEKNSQCGSRKAVLDCSPLLTPLNTDTQALKNTQSGALWTHTDPEETITPEFQFKHL
jgi:hypothetical protein